MFLMHASLISLLLLKEVAIYVVIWEFKLIDLVDSHHPVDIMVINFNTDGTMLMKDILT